MTNFLSRFIFTWTHTHTHEHTRTHTLLSYAWESFQRCSSASKKNQKLRKDFQNREAIGKVWWTANGSVRRSITDECKFPVSVKECCWTHRPQQHNNNNIRNNNNRKCFFLSARQKCNEENRKCKLAFPMIVCTTATTTTTAQQQFECHSF